MDLRMRRVQFQLTMLEIYCQWWDWKSSPMLSETSLKRLTKMVIWNQILFHTNNRYLFYNWERTKWIEDINNTNPSFKIMIFFVWTGCWIHMCFILGSGLLEFGEFCQLAAKFLVEEDEEGLKKELKEAFRIYDKEGIF